jgi:hypothetical protein
MDGDRVMTSIGEASKTLTFRANLIITALINFGINFGFEWATLGQWGKIPQEDFPPLYVIKWNSTVNSCIALDLLLTAFFIASLTTLFGTNGIVQDIKKGKMSPLDTAVTEGGLWWLTPVRVMHIGFRSLLMGLWWTVVAGLPSLGIVALALAGGPMSGVDYCVFKGLWAMIVACPVFLFMFVGCADSRLHRGLAFARLAETTVDLPPMVGQVGHV